jgi:hypothetical protein
VLETKTCIERRKSQAKSRTGAPAGTRTAEHKARAVAGGALSK